MDTIPDINLQQIKLVKTEFIDNIHGDNWLVFGQQIKKILQMQLLPAFKFYNPFHHLGHNKWRLNHLPICSQDSLL